MSITVLLTVARGLTCEGGLRFCPLLGLCHDLQELWDRINGQNPHDEGGVGGHGGADKTPRDLPEDSEQVGSSGVQLEDEF